ncbi:MAG: M23 family metallopeptidase [Lachnospiraceae bacterium]|nr:M23 family metallopeptidase [Lachnospiraceae bacterium]
MELICLTLLLLCYSVQKIQREDVETSASKKEYIKWVDCKVSSEALDCAYAYDVDTYGQKVHLNWIELIAYAAAKNGGEFPKSAVKDIRSAAEQLINKETTMKKLTKKLEYYPYFLEVYHAVLDGYVGEYEMEKTHEKKYGLKAYAPIAKGFPYSDYDDFGVSRSYGYKREHLGHDMMGQIGTPIICVLSGTVEALGWNQYGGWRIGIRSRDHKKYYYYAHLRQNYPYAKGLKVGDEVTAGEVIGYMGHTGYSTKENVNNIQTVHLHFGMQLIFDESQKDGNTEIWINPYAIVRFLHQHQAEAAKVGDTKEWRNVNPIRDMDME